MFKDFEGAVVTSAFCGQVCRSKIKVQIFSLCIFYGVSIFFHNLGKGIHGQDLIWIGPWIHVFEEKLGYV